MEELTKIAKAINEVLTKLNMGDSSVTVEDDRIMIFDYKRYYCIITIGRDAGERMKFVISDSNEEIFESCVIEQVVTEAIKIKLPLREMACEALGLKYPRW
jgi:hypothetical protein